MRRQLSKSAQAVAVHRANNFVVSTSHKHPQKMKLDQLSVASISETLFIWAKPKSSFYCHSAARTRVTAASAEEREGAAAPPPRGHNELVMCFTAMAFLVAKRKRSESEDQP